MLKAFSTMSLQSNVEITDKQYVTLSKILNIIHKEKIKINTDERKIAVQLYLQVKAEILRVLGESVFKSILKGEEHRGSFFQGVKVHKPNEFDLDIKIKLPIDYKEVKLTLGKPGYVQINIKEAFNNMAKNKTWTDKYSFLTDFIDEKGNLLPAKLLRKMESILKKVFSENSILICSDGVEYEAKIRNSGPALTVNFQHGPSEQIDIDFVLVLMFPENTVWPPKPVRKFTFPEKSGENYWFAVPKPVENEPLDWRLSFPAQESFILSKNNNLKFIYRTLKALRDKQTNLNICSYHIATLFFWEDNKRSSRDDKTFWKQELGYLFIYMLQRLSEALKNKKLSFYWHDKANFFDNYKPSNLQNLEGQINGILKKIITLLKANDETQLFEYVNNLF